MSRLFYVLFVEHAVLYYIHFEMLPLSVSAGEIRAEKIHSAKCNFIH